MVSPYFSSFSFSHSLLKIDDRFSYRLPNSNVVCPVFFVNSAAKKLISFGCHPVDGITLDGRPPRTLTPPPPATLLHFVCVRLFLSMYRCVCMCVATQWQIMIYIRIKISFCPANYGFVVLNK